MRVDYYWLDDDMLAWVGAHHRPLRGTAVQHGVAG